MSKLLLRVTNWWRKLHLYMGICLVGVFYLSSLQVYADVKLPAIFGDHMVLQQETTIPIWGWADPGEKITVNFGGTKVWTMAKVDGNWRVDLPSIPSGTPPGKLVIEAKNTIIFNDVLVGDVWLCSGQSNMEFGLGRLAPHTTDSQIRLFHVPHQLALTPRNDVSASWEVCTSENLASFSAVGFYFGNNLSTLLHRPIGLIESSWGGTGAQEWTDLPTLKANPTLQHYAETVQKIATEFPGGDAEYTSKNASHEAAMKQWHDAINADSAYQKLLKDWNSAVTQAKKMGQPIPFQPAVPVSPPNDKVPGRGTPTFLFNGMIAPLIPFAIKGAIWYQGENNTNSTDIALEYKTLFKAMITNWRSLWRQGDFPFLYVQLANFNPSNGDWPSLRESQLKTLSLPKTGMAVIIDIGTGDNIHPPDKVDVGFRLSLAARHVAYGENLVYSGPIYESMKIEGDRIRISFKPYSLGSGLFIGNAPWKDPKATAVVSTTELQGFMIAGDDQKWVEAHAIINGKTVVISCPQVPNPVAVRYAWAQNPLCNFYNKENLPASPFRTDDWDPMPTDSVRKK